MWLRSYRDGWTVELPSGEALSVGERPIEVPIHLESELRRSFQPGHVWECDEQGVPRDPPWNSAPPLQSQKPREDPRFIQELQSRGLSDVGLEAELIEHLYLRAIEGAVEEFPARKTPSGKIDPRRVHKARPPHRVAAGAAVIRWWQEHRFERIFESSEIGQNGARVFYSMVELIGEGFASRLVSLLPASRTFRNDVAALEVETKDETPFQNETDAEVTARRIRSRRMKSELDRNLKARPEGRPAQARALMEEANTIAGELARMSALELAAWARRRLQIDLLKHPRLERQSLALFQVAVNRGEEEATRGDFGSMKAFAARARNSYAHWRRQNAKAETMARRNLTGPGKRGRN